MRGSFAIIVLVACGRVDFDDRATSGRDANAAPGADAPPADPDLVAWYTMDSLAETVGGSLTLVDQSGHANDGTCTPPACPTVDTGIIGAALRFDGSADIIRAPSPAALDADAPVTVAAWFESDRFGPSSEFDCFVNKGLGTADANSWQLCLTSAAQTVVVTTYGSDTAFDTLGMTVAATTWHHLAWTWDGATSRLYLDGTKTSTDLAPAPFEFDGSPITLGADLDFNAPAGQFRGRIDDVRLYDRVLSDPEIAALAAPP